MGGDETDHGITVALVPRDTPGITIGRRHFPLNGPFQNGPIVGKDVFVPLDAIIGGPKMAGQGWRMLVEQLSVGRCISLPSIATGGA
jgi:acyl-CoA dehydrogenase